MDKHIKFIKKHYFNLILLLTAFFFSAFLMWKTFRVDQSGNMQISIKVWSDFAATIPLIRSFSLGNNYLNVQYPIFPGPVIRYHFIFYLIVGLFEKIGIPIDWSLNTLSTAGFLFLMIMIYKISYELSKKTYVGVLSVVLFLFNGSFSFLEFFKINNIGPEIFDKIIKSKDFYSFGPYDGKIISAFWNLNIFTNQRHLALAYAIFLFLFLNLYRLWQHPEKFSYKIVLIYIVLIGIFPFFHLAVFSMIFVGLGICFLLYKGIRKQIFAIGASSLIITLPQYLMMGQSSEKINLIKIGYLVEKLNFINFVNYWFLNIGLIGILGIVSYVLIKPKWKAFFLPFIAFFVIGNVFQFSPEIAANHKFFNLFIIGLDIMTANLLSIIASKNILGKMFVVGVFPFLILSGVLDFFPVINSDLITVRDYKNNNASQFFLTRTQKQSVVLNASFIYDPASLAGRKIYLGWPYFSWSAGYNTDERYKKMKTLLSPKDKISECQDLINEGINYIEIQNPTDLEGVQIDYDFFRNNFFESFEDKTNKFYIYDVSKSCRFITNSSIQQPSFFSNQNSTLKPNSPDKLSLDTPKGSVLNQY